MVSFFVRARAFILSRGGLKERMENYLSSIDTLGTADTSLTRHWWHSRKNASCNYAIIAHEHWSSRTYDSTSITLSINYFLRIFSKLFTRKLFRANKSDRKSGASINQLRAIEFDNVLLTLKWGPTLTGVWLTARDRSHCSKGSN